VGEDLGDITTASGRTYQQVKIRKVEHTGIQITDTTGPKSIDSAELPQELQERFQFDEKLKKAVQEKEEDGLETFGNNVAVATLAEKARGKLEQVQEHEARIEKSNAAIQAAKANEMRNQAALDRMRMALANEEAKRSGVSKAPQMREELLRQERAAKASLDSIPENERKVREANRDITLLKREVETIKAEIAKIKKEQEAKKSEAPPP
jgi:hypothetical protein